jgi:hypothetical protein
MVHVPCPKFQSCQVYATLSTVSPVQWIDDEEIIDLLQTQVQTVDELFDSFEQYMQNLESTQMNVRHRSSINESEQTGGRGRAAVSKTQHTPRSCWTPTKRTAVCRDGTTRVLHKNPAKPGELRVRRMVSRNGHTVASFVKP